MRQAFIILILAIGAPILRVIPNYISYFAENAVCVYVILFLIPAFLLVFILQSLIKNNMKSLYDVYQEIFGKFINKIITFIYIVWSLFLASLYLRMFGERFLGTILFDANLVAIIILMSFFVYFIVNQKIDVLGRMSEVLIFFFGLIGFGIFLLVFSKIDIKNLWPITHYDTIPILKGVIPLLSLGSYITGLMFLGDKISDIETFKKKGNITVLILALISIILVLSTVGVFGYRLNLQFLFPYFITLKNINILNTIERIESLVISTWLATDTIIISFFTLITLTLIKKFFNLNSHKKFSPWVVIFIVIISINFAPNAYAIETFTRNYCSWVNIILFLILPFIAFCIGKIRKII